MTIANDAWIRKMALEKGMITPFQEGLVSKGTISYGLSSYGYDVRVAKNFKIFHNLNSTLVDPKNFDARSFVDHVGDSCIIPPNSFVLAETVERFRIPRDVLCVCLGKCVRGDTRVVDAETGDYLPISEFRGRSQTMALVGGEELRPMPVSDFIPQGRRPVFKVATRSGLEVVATASHPFLTERGWTGLSGLKVGDRIATAGYVPIFGKERLRSFEDAVASTTRSERIPREFFRLREGDLATILRAIFTEVGQIEVNHEGPSVTYYGRSRDYLSDLRHLLLRFGVSCLVRQYWHHCNERWIYRLDVLWPDDLLRFAHHIGFIAGSQQQERLAGVVSEIRRVARYTHSRALVGAASSSEGKFRSTYDPSPTAIKGTPFPADIVWDLVDTIAPAGEEEVYDLTVPEAENFLANDVIVHNSTYARCGIIVNVTPLEPEWEGIVTIEISNTTPLPAKIYANEGIAQILFLRAAADGICETSYGDRKGKYQNQSGLTLPKIST